MTRALIHLFILFSAIALTSPAQGASCLLVGDSIAVGASMHAPLCQSLARKGIASKGWLDAYGSAPLRADTVVMSLGSNDGDGRSSFSSLWAIRSRISAGRVMWIAPGPQFPARNSAIAVAHAFGDVIFERPVENLASDRVHFDPQGYARIAMLVNPASAGRSSKAR